MVSPEPNSGCWLWLGKEGHKGYCTASGFRRISPERWAHRLAYALFIGPIPKGNQVHHKCEVRSCVNPQHLESESILGHRSTHGNRWLFPYNRPARIKTQAEQLVRLIANVSMEPNSGCWLWTGAGSAGADGYGVVSIDGRQAPAHRAMYVLLVGKIKEGMTLHHTCHVKCCVNPLHLMQVSLEEHSREYAPGSWAYENKRKVACPRGHPYDKFNTGFGKVGVGGRSTCRKCRECDRLKHLGVRRKQRERTVMP
jgi:hypothetical protein